MCKKLHFSSFINPAAAVVPLHGLMVEDTVHKSGLGRKPKFL